MTFYRVSYDFAFPTVGEVSEIGEKRVVWRDGVYYLPEMTDEGHIEEEVIFKDKQRAWEQAYRHYDEHVQHVLEMRKHLVKAAAQDGITLEVPHDIK